MTIKGNQILVVDDEASICLAFRKFFERRGYVVHAVGTVDQALAIASEVKPGLTFLDVKLGDADGLDLLPKLLQVNPGRPVIVMTAYGSLEIISKAMSAGASDYLTKPLDMQLAEKLVSQSFASHGSAVESRQAKPEDGFIGSSNAMQDLFKKLIKYAQLDDPVLICGETGTGKELAARMIHARSSRAKGPFIAVNCGAIPEALMESQLFGHRKGAFTGAFEDRIGWCQAADDGTLFLDEIGELSLAAQTRLLRFLDQKTVERLGDTEQASVNVRIVAATNKNLKEAIQMKTFRADLFYRISVLNVVTPPLREHVKDIPELAAYFLQQDNYKLALDDKAVKLLENYTWPGNVRELRSVIIQAAQEAKSNTITVDCLPNLKSPLSTTDPLQQFVDQLELGGDCLKEAVELLQKKLIKRALDESNGNQSAAAAKLGLHRNSLHRLYADGIKPSDQE